MKTEAAILTELGKPLTLAVLSIPALKPGQALVEIAFSGVCHTQLLEARGHRGKDPYLPHCIGHEGSGTVIETGPGVSRVKAGDSVILSWLKGSGANVAGTVYDWGSQPVNAGAVTTFQRHAVVSENRLTPLPPDFPRDLAALIGCAVPTGFGVVFNAAEARPGQSIGIFGTGGVGLCAIAAASVAGCFPIVAIDVVDSKLGTAKRLGATHTINPTSADLVIELKKLVPGGLDIAIDFTGRTQVMSQALDVVRMQGGTAIVVGNAHHGEKLSFDPFQLNLGKRLLGTWGGDSQPDRDYPTYCRLLAAGRVDLSPLMGSRYSLEQTNAALDDLEASRAIRPLIDMSIR